MVPDRVMLKHITLIAYAEAYENHMGHELETNMYRIIHTELLEGPTQS